MVNSGRRLRWSNLQREFPNAGPMSQPKKVAPKVATPMLMTGSVGTNFVIESANSGISENAATAAAVEARDVRMEEARAYRRRTVRRRKKVFQSRVEELGAAEAEADEVEVEEFRIRQREGVKNEDGVLVEEGGVVARCANFDRKG